jgi:hypothetical protein
MLAVKWTVLKSSVTFNVAPLSDSNIYNKSACQIPALLGVARSTVSAVIVSLPSSKLPLEAMSAQALFIGSFMKWLSIVKQPHTSLRSPCTMPSIGWSGVKLATIGHWKCVLRSDESHFTIW